jgi:FkbM family methyltransferase
VLTAYRFVTWVLEHLPARLALAVRVAANRPKLFGIGAPARRLVELVPPGKVAVDAGTNFGVYCYFIAQAAAKVHAFEPQPHHVRRLRSCMPKNVVVHAEALSDHEGVAELHIPTRDGEASLRDLGTASTTIQVPLRTLDSYDLSDLGFVKIDVEGHEETLLHGGIETLRRSNATVFIEIEERHNPGGIARIVEWFAAIGYTDVHYFGQGRLHPFADFDVARHQAGVPGHGDYVNNFVFRRAES